MNENTLAARPTSAPVKPTTVKGWIETPAFRDQVARALPKHLTPDRFLRVALTALLKTPKLATCTPESVTQCLLSCSQMGLEPDGRRAHLIPYGNACTLIVDYKGIVELAMRSGLVANLHADTVCENDAFDYDRGELKIHKIDFRKPRGEVYAVYALARLKDGSEKCEVMTKDEVESIRKRSRAGTSGPWVTDWNEMAKKTAFRRLSKWLPLSPEFRDAVEADDEPVDVTPKAAPAPIFRKREEAPALTLEVPETPPEDGDLGPQPEPAPVEVVSPVLPVHQAIIDGLHGASLTFLDFRDWATREGWAWAKELDAIHDIPEKDAVKLAKAIGSVVAKIQAGKGAA